MKLIFAGTPEIAATILEALLKDHQDVVAVFTQPDRPAGRGRHALASPVKVLAEAAGIPVEQPVSLRSADAQAVLASYQADLMIVVAYGLILPQAVLDIPVRGCWNVHVSLLPRWRGAAPIQRAIEAGDTETGVSLMQMDAGLDTGPILLQKTLAITPEMTSGILHDRLATEGAAVLLQALYVIDSLLPKTQASEGVTYAHKINKEEAVLDWNMSGQQIVNKVRAFNPWPMAQAQFHGEMLRIGRASLYMGLHQPRGQPGEVYQPTPQCIGVHSSAGIVMLEEVQRPGGKMLPIQAFLNGQPDYFKRSNNI